MFCDLPAPQRCRIPALRHGSIPPGLAAVIADPLKRDADPGRRFARCGLPEKVGKLAATVWGRGSKNSAKPAGFDTRTFGNQVPQAGVLRKLRR